MARSSETPPLDKELADLTHAKNRTVPTRDALLLKLDCTPTEGAHRRAAEGEQLTMDPHVSYEVEAAAQYRQAYASDCSGVHNRAGAAEGHRGAEELSPKTWCPSGPRGAPTRTTS